MVKAKLPRNYTEILVGRESQMLNLDSSKLLRVSAHRTEKRRHCTFQEYRGAAGNDTRNKHIVLGFWQGNRTALNCNQGLNYFQKIMQQRLCTSARFKGSATPTRIKHSYCLHRVTSPWKSSLHQLHSYTGIKEKNVQRQKPLFSTCVTSPWYNMCPI